LRIFNCSAANPESGGRANYLWKDVNLMAGNHFIHQADNSGLFISFSEDFSKLQSDLCQIAYIEGGCAVLRCCGKDFFVQSGTAVLRSPNTAPDIVYSHKLSAMSITFDPGLIRSKSLAVSGTAKNLPAGASSLPPFLKPGEIKILSINPLYRTRVKELFMSVAVERSNRRGNMWRNRAADRLKQLFRLCFDVHPFHFDSPCAELARSTLEYIHANCRKEITVRLLCQVLHTNHTSLLQTFRKYTGTTIGQYTLQLRLYLVSNALMFTGKTIEEIAEECGFGHASYLSRVFRSRIGMAPGQFRNMVCGKLNTV
jgi:AraC-like DNA-binding protein